MGTPVRTSIIDALQTLFESITTDNGYKTDVEQVEHLIRWADLGFAELPHIGFHLPAEQWEYLGSFGQFKILATGLVYAVVPANTHAARATAIDNVQDDLIAALHADASLGGLAVDVRVLGPMENDAADPGALDYAGGGRGTVIIPFEVEYHRDGSKS